MSDPSAVTVARRPSPKTYCPLLTPAGPCRYPIFPFSFAFVFRLYPTSHLVSSWETHRACIAGEKENWHSSARAISGTFHVLSFLN